MPGQELSLVLRHVRSLLSRSGAGDSTDADLLARFAARREEAAFAAVLERHGPLVFGVCRRVLGDAHDAEDAFQATFLVLARRAASIRRGASLSSWLHGVAYRVALEARTRLARRRRNERQAAALPRHSPPADDSGAELRPLIDEELRRLPEKYRAPLVLHYLEGKTKQEAARQLGWSEGTVSGRLDRARKLLRQRLLRRGVALTAGTVAAVPPALQTATLSAALGRVAVVPAVASLAEGAFRAALMARLKLGAALCFLVGVLAAGTGLAFRSVPGSPSAGAGQALAEKRDLPPPAPPVPDDPDEEGPGTKERAIEKLEAVTPERWEASWKEDLDATGQPAGEILRQQVRKLDLTLETTPAQERALAQPLHLKLRAHPRLELVEEVCRRVGLYPVYPDGTTRRDAWNRTLRLEEGPRKLPVTFAGPFLVEVEDLKEFAPSATGEMRVRFLAVGLPPAVALPLTHGELIALTKVSAPQGGNLIDTGRLPNWTGNETYEGYDISQYVYLKGLVRGAGDRLTVEGNLRVPIATRVETLRFGELKPGMTRTAGDVQVTLQAVTRMALRSPQVETRK